MHDAHERDGTTLLAQIAVENPTDPFWDVLASNSPDIARALREPDLSEYSQSPSLAPVWLDGAVRVVIDWRDPREDLSLRAAAFGCAQHSALLSREAESSRYVRLR
ncbi:hypothetical protein PHYC_00516 [Phycisphaerales bacterium]|nr:hypothetical protein PHYC_00516 [Phycisphaerales bacterium]